MILDAWKDFSAGSRLQGYGLAETSVPRTDEESVRGCRRLCEQNLCREYGTTWACPPGVGPADACVKEIKRYSRAALITKRFEGIDTGDDDLTMKLGKDMQDACRRFANFLRRRGFEVFPMADVGCGFCAACTYPGGPCRFPAQMVASRGGYGIIMDRYLSENGMPFAFEKGAATFYGIILYNPPRPPATGP
ncbi:MAG: DUF2284 domain-containing protein [Candidatus Methanoplasma sp.]|jgi:predicted metal-binding protein|nr:DUF2284 domain-containing protein [Candidatus Methanoplasma sp.]